MNRYDIFDQVFSSHLFLNLFYKDPDGELRKRWDEMSQVEREKLFSLPLRPEEYIDMGIAKIPANEHVANVRDVAEYYRFRATDSMIGELPGIFRKVMVLGDDDDMLDTLFFGTLGALSICLPGVHGSLFKEEVHPNLYIFLTGAAASGKGKIGLCRKLLEPLNESMVESKIIIPANSSDTALYEELFLNGGRGIIFESEADTLTQAFKKGSGKFSDGLRCAFHNEAITYLRRKDKERVYIEHPVLSMVLTGTPGQVPLLLQSPENGLFSRILFYRLTSEKESFAEDIAATNAITGEMVNDYMRTLGREVMLFYIKLSQLDGITFRLTEEQHKDFMDHFHDITAVYKNMAGDAYGTYEAVEHIDSIMKRLGNICYRMMMILSVSRLMDGPGDKPLPREVECDKRDFRNVIFWSEFLFHHTLIHYDELMVATGKVPEVEEDDPTDDDMLSDKQRQFYEALPDTFIKQKALQIGVEMALPTRSVARYLNYYCDLGILVRRKRGSYEKIVAVVDEGDPGVGEES